MIVMKVELDIATKLFKKFTSFIDKTIIIIAESTVIEAKANRALWCTVHFIID